MLQHIKGWQFEERKHVAGKRYGKLLVVKRLPNPDPNHKTKTRNSATVWILCKCDCGNEVKVTGTALGNRKNPKTNCGCEPKKRGRKPKTIETE
jgi:hypothetical protein